MPNSWFKFKQFIISQDKCAMKVGTDSILLGAWANCDNCNAILDIGTGTGILSLMMAQRFNAKITGIEIDENSAKQAQENIILSPWKNRITILNKSIQEYKSEDKLDLIIINPPFFQDSLQAPEKSRTLARHNESLSPHEIINYSKSLLSTDGRLAIIWPIKQGEAFEKEAFENGFFCSRKTFVKSNPLKKPHRILMELCKKETKQIISEIIIDTGIRHQYSEEYKQLTQDFYLRFKN